MLIDTHSHLFLEEFAEDLPQVMERARHAGVSSIFMPNIDSTTIDALLSVCAKYPDLCYPMIGLHPTSVNETYEQELAIVRERLSAPNHFVAIGEIGLDYYWAENPPRELQQQLLRAQLALARALRLPVIFHDREAHGDSLAIVREFPDVTGVFHCFSGSPEMARELLDLGWYLGFDGPVTYKNARRAPEVAAVTPLDRMLIETDSPYMTPVPFRGKRNDSRFLPYVAEKLAEWKGVTTEEMTDITFANGKRLFGIE